MSIGLTDEIINHLFKIASFDEVRSLSSVMVYKDSDRTTPQIGRELKVNYVLEGTYKKIGDRVKVTAQLIVAETDNHIWYNEYERPYEEIMGIQAEIALQIAGHIDAFITSSERQNIEKIPTTNQEAYELVKQVVYLIELFTEGSLNLTADQVFEQGSDYCSRAIELDPSYADAYALAGLLFQARGWHIGLDEPTTVTPVAQHYYQKALELDPDNAQAHHGMSVINFFYNWDHIKAEEEYLKAVELQPNNQIFRMGLSEFYLKLDRPEEALLYADTSIKINILMGNPEKAYQALKLWSGSAGKENYKRIAENYLWLEEYDSARLYFEYARHFTDQLMLVPRFQACQALAYHQTNEPDLARNIINRLIAKANETSAGSPDYFTGWYYSGIQEVDSAFYWLDKAYISKSAEMTWLKVDPVFNNLKQNDRYWDLYERTGFKAYDDYLAGQQKRD
jgi:adenylate cyclase